MTTPRGTTPGARLPVMFWIHGGGYTNGSGGAYGAQRLASQGHVMVVTINYRLGVFGYLGLPGLKGGGDFGLQDAVTALRWTRHNAAAFGGNPHNVTVFGESAGAMETCALLTSPAARGLIEKAGSESGSCMFNWPKGGLLYKTPAQTPYTSLRANNLVSSAIAKQLHCHGAETLACLRRLPAKKLLAVSKDFSDQLAYGTPLLPRDPATAIRAGRSIHIPYLSGTNAHEEFALVGGVQQSVPSAFTPASYPTLLKSAFGSAAPQVAAKYPLSAYPSAGAAFATLITDDSWACSVLTGDQLMAAHMPIYAFEFNDPHSPNVNDVAVKGIPQGSAHATELPYLWNLGNRNLLTNPASRRLAKTMIAYWTSFAHTGTPSATGEPAWPRFGATGTTAQGLDASGIAPVDLSAEHQCPFWRSVNPMDRP